MAPANCGPVAAQRNRVSAVTCCLSDLCPGPEVFAAWAVSLATSLRSFAAGIVPTQGAVSHRSQPPAYSVWPIIQQASSSRRPLSYAFRALTGPILKGSSGSIVLKNPQNALAPNSRICAATLGINADYGLKAPRKATEGEGRLLAGSPSNFRRSLCAVTGIVIDRKIRVFQHRVMGGSSST